MNMFKSLAIVVLISTAPMLALAKDAKLNGPEIVAIADISV